MTNLSIFRAVVESMSEGVLVADCEGSIVFANRAATEMLRADLEGRPIAELAPLLFERESRRPLCAEDLPLAAAICGRRPPVTEVMVPGSIPLLDMLLSADCRPVHASDGSLLGGVAVLRDVSEHMRAQERLARATTFLDSIVENVPDMIFVKDAKELRFERFNRAGEQLLGMTREELIGRNDFDFFPAEQASFFQARDRETLRRGELVDIPEEPIDTQRGLRWLHTKKVTIHDEQGNPRYLLGISSDVTEKREALQALHAVREELERRVDERTRELEQAEEQLRHAQKMEAVGRLAGGVAHDFNNMLAVILGRVAVLERAGSPDGVLEHVGEIRTAAERAAELTKQLLAFSRKGVMQPAPLDLSEAVARAEGMLKRLIGEDIVLVTRLAHDPGTVYADPGMLEQVIVNLAVNARDAMPQGGCLTVETADTSFDADSPELPSGAAPGMYVCLRVADTGIGMDAATQARVFEPFFTTKALGQGTGLGLSTVYGIVTQSRGFVLVESALGRGTTFEVHLPRLEGEPMVTPASLRHEVMSGRDEVVLLVEDEDLVRAVMRTLLEQAGYRVLEAGSPDQALRISENQSGPIHVLLTDVVMPGMNGRKLAERIAVTRPDVRVLYMSGYTDDILGRHGVLEPGTHFVTKPFSAETLANKLREVLGAEEREACGQ